MANLETLELKISANAQEAKQGLEALMQSLSALSTALIKPYADLRDFNEELKNLKNNSKIKFSIEGTQSYKAVEKTTSAIKKQADTVKWVKSTMKEYVGKESGFKSWMYGPNIASVTNNTGMEWSEEEARERTPQWYYTDEEWQEAVNRANKVRESMEEIAPTAKKVAEETDKITYSMATGASRADALRMQIEGVRDKIATATSQEIQDPGKIGKLSEQLMNLEQKLYKLENPTEEVAEETESALSKMKEGWANFTKTFTDLWSRITRIATTMMIRKALKGLVKYIKEGINNLYEWSKAVGGTFAESMDKAKSSIGLLKNSLGAALSPLIMSLIPIINSLTSALVNAVNWINQFISLLTGKSSWTRAIEQSADATDGLKQSAGGATKAAKEMLAAFDELNVIGNESDSGGGGGGGGTVTDYSGLFEEVTAFDGKIREIVEFLKDNMESIKAIAVATGVAILSWKFGTAFLETLPLLSTIFGYVGTGAVIAITAQLSYMLTDQYLNTGDEGYLWANLLTTAVGSTAAWAIAKKLIGGTAAKYAVAVTLACSAIADIAADVKNTNVDAFSKESVTSRIVSALKMGAAAGITLVASGVGVGWALAAAGGVALVTFGVATLLKLGAKENTTIAWGSVSLAQEQIDEWVSDKWFTMNPKVMISLVSDNLKMSEMQQIDLQMKLNEIIPTMNVIRLGLANDNDYETLKEQITGKGGLVDIINGWINSAEVTNKLVLQLTPKLVGSTPAEQQAWYQNASSGWETVRTFVNDLGKQLADEIVKGEKDELKGKRSERVQNLLDEMNTIANIINGSDAGTETTINFDLKLQDLNKDSFNDALATFSKYKEDIAKSAKELEEAAYANQARLVAALTKMVELDPDNPELKKQLEQAQAGLVYMKEHLKENMDKTADELAAPGRNIFKEWIKNNFGVDNDKFGLEGTNFFNNPDAIRDRIKEDFEDGMSEILTEITGVDIPPVNVMDFLELGGWDALRQDTREQILSAIQITPDLIEKLKKACHLDAPDIIKLVKWGDLTKEQRNNMIKSIMDAFGTKALPELKKKVPNLKATDLVQIVQWSDWSDKEKLEYIKAISDAYKDPAVLQEGYGAGLALTVKIKEGMAGGEASVRTEADRILNLVQNKFKKSPMKIQTEPDDTSANKTAQELTDFFAGKTPKVKVGAEKKPGGQTTPGTIEYVLKQIKDAVDGKSFWVEVNATLGNLSTLQNSFKSALEAAIKKIVIKPVNSGNGGNINLTTKASGGLVASGDIFVANENGKSEMIGRFGNQTAVANQEQMVTAMAEGVYRANAEQNQILREQNNILLGILQKEGTINLGASSALGRTVQQSLEMYSAVTG